ncbi:MAG TPA: hypothetical protein VJ927_00380 [Actinomycetota bacterium]|nr:hypothetical protein [Actinomycetota bacterium]
MTALIGGSLLLIAGSAIALVIGWTSADESLIWTSIAASVGAAVMLSLGYYRSRAEAARRPRRNPESRSESETSAPAARPRTAEPPPTQQTPVVTASDERVVAYADRSRFHRPDCRYASLPGGEKITREAATRRGYDPCGVCKP